MRVYRITADDWDYDQFDSIVVLAESEERALEIANMKHHYGQKYFADDQYPLIVEEIDMTKEQVVLSSFNAG